MGRPKADEAAAVPTSLPAAANVEPPVVAAPQSISASAVEVPAGSTVPGESRSITDQPQASAIPDNPFLSPIESDGTSTPSVAPVEAPPETTVTGVTSEAAVPAIGGSAGATGSSWTWLAWLGGSGIALVLALLLFGRKFRHRFSPAAAPVDSLALRRKGDIDDTDVSPILGLPAQGTAAVARRVSLDADLEDGSGFQYGGDIDVAQDFGFTSGSSTLDHGLDIDLGAEGEESHGRTTDIIAPRRTAEATILVSETPPRHDDSGEYDVSMIVDATRQLLDDANDTTKDLHAIEVDAAEDDAVPEEYTLSRDVDYKILEQDYEDELTATQALSAEITKAAQALSRQFGKDEMGDTLTDTMNEAVDDDAFQHDVFGSIEDETVALPVAEALQSIGDTAQMSVRSTVNLDDTANEEIALELPAAENDSTVEVESGTTTIDTRKIRAS